MINTLYKLSGYIALGSGIILGFPYLGQLKEMIVDKKIDKQALRDKIKYNGMTVNRIGKISQFIQPKPSYIKGSLIRLEDITDDFHMIKAISDELYKGVFI